MVEKRYLHCPKCLVGGTKVDEAGVGGKCPQPTCDGTIEYAPLWSELVDILPGKFTCGRRFDVWAGTMLPVHSDRDENEDYWWQFKTNKHRVCSYCGSLHPDDFFSLVKECAESDVEASLNSVVEIEPTDKRYKIYVRVPGVRNASEGGIKFYTEHLPPNISEEQRAQYKEAVARSHARFEKMIKSMHHQSTGG